mgnify:CR=1 FL=1
MRVNRRPLERIYRPFVKCRFAAIQKLTICWKRRYSVIKSDNASRLNKFVEAVRRLIGWKQAAVFAVKGAAGVGDMLGVRRLFVFVSCTI